jgi:hypothetical protein
MNNRDATLIVGAIIAAAADGDPQQEKRLTESYFRVVNGIYDGIRERGGSERRK